MPLNCFQDGDLAPLPMLSKVQYHSENHRPQVQTRLLTPQETPCIAAKLAYKPRFQPSGTSNSMLQDLLDADHGIPSSDPSTSTFGCRRLILARAAATLQTAFSDALNASMSSSTGVDEMSSFNFDTFETTAWNSHWEGKKFTGLWEQRENLELLRYKLHQNRQVIQKTIRDKDNPAVIPKDSSHPDDPANKTTADLEYHRNAQLLMYHQEENDRLEWVDLDNTAEYINQVIVRTTASYLQTVQAREAQVSNFQARR